MTGERRIGDGGPKVGEHWKEVDARLTRVVEIMRVEGDYVSIRNIERNPLTGKEPPVRKAQLRRFNGASSGYRKIKDAPDLAASGEAEERV